MWQYDRLIKQKNMEQHGVDGGSNFLSEGIGGLGNAMGEMNG